MSAATPAAVLAVALVGALLVAVAEPLVAGARPDLGAMGRTLRRRLREPLAGPETYDPFLFHMAPGLLVLAAVGALAFVPWTSEFRGIDHPVGGILFAGLLAYVTPAVFMAGWGDGRPLAVVGGFRFIASMLAYAMPIAMVITAVAAPAGSLRPTDIVDAQQTVPMAVAQPLAFALWLPAVAAVSLRPPFDLPQAPGELGGGTFAGYQGLDALLVGFARRVLLVAVSGMTAALFLGGWHWPLLPEAAWMALKTAAVAAVILWAGARVPRVRIERLLPVAWKIAIPGAIAAIVYAALLTLAFYR